VRLEKTESGEQIDISVSPEFFLVFHGDSRTNELRPISLVRKRHSPRAKNQGFKEMASVLKRFVGISGINCDISSPKYSSIHEKFSQDSKQGPHASRSLFNG
jgi:hypothetical protein